MDRLRIEVFILTASGMAVPLFAQAENILTSVLCGIIGTVQSVIGILALALFMFGGVVYALSYFLPTTLDIKKSITSWSTAMITGGVLGLIIVIIAPFIVNMIANLGSSIITHC